MSITKITTPELLDFPNDSTSSANTSGTVIPKGYTNACNFPTFSSGVAFYQFENNNANDTCGNYNLTEVGSPSYVTAGNFGEAIQFNGTSQGVTSTSAVIPNGPATISLWFNGNSTATMEFYIIGVGVGGSSYGLDIHYYDDGIVGGRFYGGVVDGGGFQGVGTGSTTVNTSTWYHLALTWDGSTNADSMKLYLNGALETNITPTVTAASLTYSSFGIGKTATATYAPGIVDQVRIFNSVLTSTQITELYNETTTELYRPTTSLNSGEFRFNTTADYVEYYDGSSWQQIADEYITGQPTACICNYPTTGVALYQFEDNANDTCGNYNATAGGNITYDTGLFGKAAKLIATTDSAADAITLPDAVADLVINNFTVSFWMNPSYLTDTGSFNEVNPFAFQKGRRYFISFFNTGVIRTYNGSSALDSSTGVINQTDVWYNVVMTQSSSTGRALYVNNILVASDGTTSDNASYNPGGSENIIGGYKSSSAWGLMFRGLIDQFRIIPSVLTTTQITELYNEIVCN